MGAKHTLGAYTYPFPTTPFAVEGYGRYATGGEGYPVYTVTNPAGDKSAGTLSSILNSHGSDCIIQFDPSLERVFMDYKYGVRKNITIDGLRNGCKGIVIDGSGTTGRTGIFVDGYNESGNVIIRGLNFRGNNLVDGAAQDDLCGIDADSGHTTKVLVDRCTFWEASDSALDIYGGAGGAEYVTYQHCLLGKCGLALLIKYGSNHRISIHHCAFVASTERNPWIRGGHGPIDFVNNCVFLNQSTSPWPSDFYEPWCQDPLDKNGMTICASGSPGTPGEPIVNVRGCAFLGDSSGIHMDIESGYTGEYVYWDPAGSDADSNYFSGCQIWSGTSQTGPWTAWFGGPPKETPNSIPTEYAVTRMAITAMATGLVPYLGCPRRYGEDETLLEELRHHLPTE